MRTLASLGILNEDASHRFALTPVGEALRTGAPGSARATVLTMASSFFVQGVGQLLYSIQTGKSGFEKVTGMPIFDWLANTPRMRRSSVKAWLAFMAVNRRPSPPPSTSLIVKPLSTWAEHPATCSPQFWAGIRAPWHFVRLASRRPRCPALIAARGLNDRVTIEGGSFFDRVPSGGDAYLLSHIIHDWSHEQCLQILGNCRKAMSPTSRLLIIEMVLPAENVPHPGKLLDMMMLVGPGGRERTEEEYRALLAEAGFRLNQVVPTESPVGVVEAVLT